MNGSPDIPSLDDLRRQLAALRHLRQRGAGWGIALLAALAMLATSFYSVQPEEIGVVLRFGRYKRSADPGLHLRVPFGVERVVKVPVQRQLKHEFGFRTRVAGVRSQYDTDGFDDESLMLTGDLNIADVEWVVQFRILDAERYLFRVRDIDTTLRAMTEATMREVVGDRTVNEVLTVGRQEIASKVEVELQVLCDQYETGLRIEQVVLQNVNPPDAVKPSFNEVNQAQQEKEEKINAAQSAYNQVIPRARGEAAKKIEEARGYAIDRVNRALGDAQRFDAMLTEYLKAPEVTRTRMYLETMGSVLPSVKSKVIVEKGAASVLPLLSLNNLGIDKESK
jgi:membrane protease subunit HflK